MIQEYNLRLLPREAADEQGIRASLVREKGLAPADITAIRILKRGIDARHRTVFVNLSVRVYLNEQPAVRRSSSWVPVPADCLQPCA